MAETVQAPPQGAEHAATQQFSDGFIPLHSDTGMEQVQEEEGLQEQQAESPAGASALPAGSAGADSTDKGAKADEEEGQVLDEEGEAEMQEGFQYSYLLQGELQLGCIPTLSYTDTISQFSF